MNISVNNKNIFDNILNNIIIKKNDRNLIISNNFKEFQNLNLLNWLYSSIEIYNIYYGKAYNPPFFNNIICLKKNNIENIEQIWNMTLLGGSFIIESKFKSYFVNSFISEFKNYILIKKNFPITYIFPKYRIIEFIIAGTMKGGTTAAIKNFNKHPEIGMTSQEIHYYDIKKNYQKGLDWYKSHFDYSKKIVGDKAPDVMYMFSCLELLQIINPQVKIILFLRNPVERAYSHWKMTRDHFGNKNSFEYSVKDELNNRMGENKLYNVAFYHHFIQRGFYYEQILEILKYFSKDNIFIVISEKVRLNMDLEYQKIFNFLGVNEFHSDFEEDFISIKNDVLDKKSKLYKELKLLYKDDVKKLEKFIGYKTDWW
jgi:hypothetical protein